MDDEKMMGPNDIKITKSVKLVDTKITGSQYCMIRE